MRYDQSMTKLLSLLTETEVAERLNVSIRTLQGWRLRGGGPLYVKIGARVRYRGEDLDAFVAAGLRRHTSDPGAV